MHPLACAKADGPNGAEAPLGMLLVGARFVGCLAGDSLVDRFGQRIVAAGTSEFGHGSDPNGAGRISGVTSDSTSRGYFVSWGWALWTCSR